MPSLAASDSIDQRKAHLERMVFASLRSDIIFQKQLFKNEIYYVIKDPLALTYFRLQPQEAYLLCLFDGKRTLKDIAAAFAEEYPNATYDLESIASFANQLGRSGLLNINAHSFLEYAKQKPSSKNALFMFWVKGVSKLMFMKLPLLDPSKWLGKLVHAIRFVWSPMFVLSGLALFLFTFFWVYVHRGAFAQNTTDFFSPENLFLLSLSVIIIKTLHEFGHASTCRYYGGEVHEMGVCLICFMPCGYVNASDAWMMPKQRYKIYVTVAGVFTEFIIASIAAYCWLNLAEGLAKNLAFNAMIVASINTLVFNMNPLMKFDGYYVISDLLEIPNLRSKSMLYCSYHLQRIFLGYCNIAQKRQLENEYRGKVFIIYALCAYVYMAFVIYSLSQLFARFLERYELKQFGLILGIAAQGSFLLFPIIRMFYDAFKPGAHIESLEPLWRRLLKWGALVTCAVGILFFIPVHFNVETQGVVVADIGEAVSSPVAGFLDEVYVYSGQWVLPGQKIARLRNAQLQYHLKDAYIDFCSAQLKLSLDTQKGWENDQINTPVLLSELEEAQIVYEEAYLQSTHLELFSKVEGQVATKDLQNLVGQYFDEETTLLELVNPSILSLAIPVTEEQVSMLSLGNQYKGRLYGKGESLVGVVQTLTFRPLEPNEYLFAMHESFGGPVQLAAQTNNDISQTPVFLLKGSIGDVSQPLQEGMRVHLTIKGNRTTLAAKIWRKILNMWNLRADPSNPFSQV